MTKPDHWLTAPHLWLSNVRQFQNKTDKALALEVLSSGAPVGARMLALRDAMFAAQPINTSEHRAAGHWAARRAAIENNSLTEVPEQFSPEFDPEFAPDSGEDRLPKMRRGHQRCREFADAICSQSPSPVKQKVSANDIKHVIHIGIGGSDLGPQLMIEALSENAEKPRPKAHFLSNLDHHAVQRLIDQIAADQTLVIVASKSFTTQETLANARHLQQWMQDQGIKDWRSRFIAITADPPKAIKWGIDSELIFEMDETIGGRYSLWSEVSLIARIALGNKAVDEMLLGGVLMDEHFLTAPLNRNLPAVLACADFYNLKQRGLPTLMVCAYDSRLTLLVPYLKQLWMESLGKQVTTGGEKLESPACPILWGDVGTNAQHAFFQLLHQGVQGVAIDLIGVIHPDHESQETHTALLSNLFAQAQALSLGKKSSSPEKTCLGGHPVNLLMLESLSPAALGSLIALWEHRVLCLSAFTHVNPFDQWGVVLGKSMAATIEKALAGPSGAQTLKDSDMDAITLEMIDWVRSKKN